MVEVDRPVEVADDQAAVVDGLDCHWSSRNRCERVSASERVVSLGLRGRGTQRIGHWSSRNRCERVSASERVVENLGLRQRERSEWSLVPLGWSAEQSAPADLAVDDGGRDDQQALVEQLAGLGVPEERRPVDDLDDEAGAEQRADERTAPPRSIVPPSTTAVIELRVYPSPCAGSPMPSWARRMIAPAKTKRETRRNRARRSSSTRTPTLRRRVLVGTRRPQVEPPPAVAQRSLHGDRRHDEEMKATGTRPTVEKMMSVTSRSISGGRRAGRRRSPEGR